MKSFKYYISESEGIQSLVHPSEKKSLDMVGYKSWITPEGKVINLPHAAANNGEYHHIHSVVDHPELFGTTSEKLESLDPENYSALTQTTNLGYRKFTWNAPIINDLARRGYIRVQNQSYANEGHPEHGSIMKHVFQLSHHDYQSEESLKAFVPALKKIRETIVQTQIHPKHDVVRITLESKDDKGWQRYSHQLRSLSDIDGFLGNDEPKHTSVTELPDVPRQLNSTQRRAMLGRTPPEGSNVPQAIWNNMRTIGDSYTPMMGFKHYILENESKPERKDIFHSFFVSKHGDIIEPTTPPLQAHMRNVDHLYIPLVHPEKFGMSDREMDDVLELDDQVKLGLFKTGQGPMDASVDRRLSSRGFIRAINGAYEDPYSAPERRRITLAATTTGTADRHHLDHLTPAIKAIRGRLSDHPDWKMKIYGLKFHEPHELEAMKHRLSPSHIQQLTDGSEIEFNNTDEIDRFIHGHGKISRDPGSGVESIPTPEEMRRKAGRTDEPESIQRGRFFQSDSYNPIMGFKQYITESISSHTDQIKNVLVAAAQEHGFDPRDLESHRRLGTHHRLLTSDDGMDIYHSVGGTPESISGRTNRYSFKIPGLDKRHNPEVYMSINTGHQDTTYLPHHAVDFLFGEHHDMHPTLLPHERSDIMNHVFNGVMRSLTHFTIADRIDPSRDTFFFVPYTNAMPATTSSGKTRRISPTMQKRRLYQNMMDSLMHLHSQLRSR